MAGDGRLEAETRSAIALREPYSFAERVARAAPRQGGPFRGPRGDPTHPSSIRARNPGSPQARCSRSACGVRHLSRGGGGHCCARASTWLYESRGECASCGWARACRCSRRQAYASRSALQPRHPGPAPARRAVARTSPRADWSDSKVSSGAGVPRWNDWNQQWTRLRPDAQAFRGRRRAGILLDDAACHDVAASPAAWRHDFALSCLGWTKCHDAACRGTPQQRHMPTSGSR